MTPFDDAKSRPVDPGEAQPAPNDPGDRIATLEAQVAVLECELVRLRDRERQRSAVLELYHRIESDRARLHAGLGGADKYIAEALNEARQLCDCTMGRQGFLHHVRMAIRNVAGGPGD